MQPEIKDKIDRYVVMAFGVCILIAAWYLYFPHTAVTPQDSDGPELAAVAVTGGIIHPPGYPFYSIIIQLFVYLVPGSPIASLAILSAVFQSFAAYVLFFVCYRLTRNSVTAFALAFSWMLFEPVMRTATDVEVFALHHLIVVVLLYLLFWFQRKKLFTSYDSFILGLICGLGVSHHHTIILWAPFVIGVFIELMLSLLPRERKDRVGALFSGIAAGMLPYAVLFVSGGLEQNIAFQAPSNLYEFISYLFRFDYGTFSLASSQGSQFISYLPHFLETLITQMPLAAAGFPLLIVYSVQQRRFDTAGLLVSGVFHFWFASKIILSPDIALTDEWAMRFYGLLGLYAVVALAQVIGAVVETYTIKLMIAAAVLIPTMYVLPLSLAASDARSDLIIAAELKSIIEEVPAGEVFIASLDRTAMGMHYMQQAQGQGRDVILIVEGLLKNARYVNSLPKRYSLFKGFDFEGRLNTKELIELALREGRQVFAYRETRLPDGYVGLPMGVTVQVVRKDFPVRYRDVVERLAGFCSRWPDALGYTNYSRSKSEIIKEQVFLGNLNDHLQTFGDSPLAPPLHAAIQAFQGGRMDYARHLCTRTLEKISGEKEWETSPYIAEY